MGFRVTHRAGGTSPVSGLLWAASRYGELREERDREREIKKAAKDAKQASALQGFVDLAGHGLNTIGAIEGEKRKGKQRLAEIDASSKANTEARIAIEREKAKIERLQQLDDILQPEFNQEQTELLQSLREDLDRVNLEAEDLTDEAEIEENARTAAAIEGHMDRILRSPARLMARREVTLEDWFSTNKGGAIKDPETGELLGYAYVKKNANGEAEPAFFALPGARKSSGGEKGGNEGPWSAYGTDQKTWDKVTEQAILAAQGDGEGLTAADVTPEQVNKHRERILSLYNYSRAQDQPQQAAPAAPPVVKLPPTTKSLTPNQKLDLNEAITAFGESKWAIDSLFSVPGLADAPPYAWDPKIVMQAMPHVQRVLESVATIKRSREDELLTDEERQTVLYAKELIWARDNYLSGGGQ